jgi:hypothetical protein
MRITLNLACVLAISASTQALCTRDSLKANMDSFFTSSIKQKSSLTFSTSAKIGQNNQVLPSLQSSAWSNITGFYKPFRIDAIDTNACTMASFVLVTEKTPAGTVDPGLMSVRMKTEDGTSTIKELEILNVLKGSHMFFVPSSFPTSAPAMWSTPQVGNFSRDELIRRANTYPSGIQAGDGSMIPAGPSCPRIENGVQTTTTCNKGLQMFKQPVTNRRWVADTLTGVVLGEFYFDKIAGRGANYGLWLNEYFKLDEGKLSGIQACMKELPGKFVDVFSI